MTREDFIMSLAENITMVTILCMVAGLLIGWYVTQSYYKSHETSGGFCSGTVGISTTTTTEKEVQAVMAIYQSRKRWR